MLRTARWVTGSAARELVLFALIWFWMLQLLIPFGEATQMPSVAPFGLFLGLLFVFDLLFSHGAMRFIGKLIALVVFVKMMYYPYVAFYDPGWVEAWLFDLYYAISGAVSVALPMLSEAARTTGFFVALILLQAVFRQCLRYRIWMFVFLMLGSVGLGVLDTFFVDDAKWHIVLFLLIGLVILAFMQLPLIERIARMPLSIKGWPVEWLVWTLVLSLIVVGTASATPKQEKPSWPDPVAYLQGKSGDGTVHQKIGYGSDDRQLGGPFEMDDSVVFEVTTASEGYFRGEAKTVYTGKGWLSASMGIPVGVKQNLKPYQNYEAGNMDELNLTVINGMGIQDGTVAQDTTLETKEVKQTFTFEQDMVPVVFNQYRMTGISDIQNQSDQTRYSGVDSRFDLTTLKKGDTYSVISQVPYFDEKQLKGANVPTITRGMEPYVSLPNTLPQRVKDLAKDITKDAKTPYERAQALESYLRSNYIYDTKTVPVPKDNQDFVDQFLFDSKRGYCDHFSSSMVVMARSLGMPARWVKGFTMGDPDLSWKSDVEGEYKYVVKNKNAHSWPEIYFEKIGWVAFEPTATFNMQRNFKQDQETLAPIPAPTTPEVKRDKNQTQDQTTKTSTTLDINWKAVGMYAGYALLAALVVALFNRRRLLTAYYLRRAYKGEGDVVINAVARLFFVLEKLGWRRRSDMTLREYALHLSGSREIGGREMVPLAKLFERVRYGQGNVGDKDRHQLRDLWTRLVRKAGRNKRRK